MTYPRRQPNGDLAVLLENHRAAPWPNSVKRGQHYGLLDAVMIDADIYGWSSRVSDGEILDAVDEQRFALAVDELENSLQDFPQSGRDYFKTLVEVGHLALAKDQRSTL